MNLAAITSLEEALANVLQNDYLVVLDSRSKKVTGWKISQNTHCAGVSFLLKLQPEKNQKIRKKSPVPESCF